MGFLPDGLGGLDRVAGLLLLLLFLLGLEGEFEFLLTVAVGLFEAEVVVADFGDVDVFVGHDDRLVVVCWYYLADSHLLLAELEDVPFPDGVALNKAVLTLPGSVLTTTHTGFCMSSPLSS